MPGLTIHIAIGKEFIRKNKGQVKNEQEFIKGTIAPDLNETMTELTNNKSSTHYGEWGDNQVKTDIKLFINDKKVDLQQDFWKGYLLHLLVDYYFYNKYFKTEHEETIQKHENFYDDYYMLNYYLISKYNIKILSNIKKYMSTDKKDLSPKYLKLDKVIDFIDKMSNINLEKEIEIIEKEGMEGLI